MKRIIAVLTDEGTGRAKFGTVEFPQKVYAEAEPPVRIIKNPRESADPHHPIVPTLLTIENGSHSIFVPTEDGREEIECRLEKGDQILFLDFKPERQPAIARRFCYSGHWSRSGPNGAVLLRVNLGSIDYHSLHWINGLPS